MDQPINIDGPEVRLMRSLCHELEISIGIGIGETIGQKRYSTYLLIDADGSLGLHRKTCCKADRPAYDLGKMAVSHRLAGINVGIMVCSECRFPEVARGLAMDGADLLVIPIAYSRLVDPRFDNDKWRGLGAIFEHEVCLRAKETGLAVVAVAASGSYERKGKGLYRYEFESGFALVDQEGRLVISEINNDVTRHRFQIFHEEEPMEIFRV
jgi:predicted amidohydrolase